MRSRAPSPGRRRAVGAVCLSVDVEWAAPEVLADLVGLIDERGLRATFFCTHEVDLPRHERAMHPNFRLNGDMVRALRREMGPAFETAAPVDVYRRVVAGTHRFCPEAVGVRAHSLIYDSELLPVYHEAGLRYDSSYLLPLAPQLQPVWKEYDILELPIYFNDHFELKSGATGFKVDALRLATPGMKIFQFHPNMVFINAATNEQYLQSKPAYHDHDRLLEMRHRGRGARTLFLDLLDYMAGPGRDVLTLQEVDALWRRQSASPTSAA